MEHYSFVTQSSDKVVEAERILGIKLERYELELPEIQAIEVEEVVINKVKYAYDALGGRPVMVEDTGLYIEAWNGLPGALIKWFIKYVGNEGICCMMHEFSNKRALAKTVVATYDGKVQLFTGEVHGQLASVAMGEGGFGWDRIFIPNGTDRTFGEMSPDEKDKFSMRRLAFEAMASQYSGNKQERSNA